MTSRKHSQKQIKLLLGALRNTVRVCSSKVVQISQIWQEGLHSASMQPIRCIRQLADHLFTKPVSKSYNPAPISLEILIDRDNMTLRDRTVCCLSDPGRSGKNSGLRCLTLHLLSAG